MVDVPVVWLSVYHGFTWLCCANTAEWIQVLFAVEILVGPRNVRWGSQFLQQIRCSFFHITLYYFTDVCGCVCCKLCCYIDTFNIIILFVCMYVCLFTYNLAMAMTKIPKFSRQLCGAPEMVLDAINWGSWVSLALYA